MLTTYRYYSGPIDGVQGEEADRERMAALLNFGSETAQAFDEAVARTERSSRRRDNTNE
jgi:hypothetical protein